MKFRVILIVLFTLPVLLKGQSDVIFYSEAPMHVKYKEGEADKGAASSTTLYIDGSVKFATGSSIEQKGRTEITKDFINAKDPLKEVSAIANLFVNKTSNVSETEGVVAFIGQGEKGASTLQRIYGMIPAGSTASIDLQKTLNWIDFPTISVEKGLPTLPTEDWRDLGYVMVDISGSISVDYINAKRGDRFAVNAGYDSSTGGNPRIINSGYARIKDITAATDRVTYSQVNLSLYEYEEGTVDDGKFVDNGSGIPVADPATFGKTLRNDQGWNYLTGFSSPFASLGADYMFYHALAKPNAESITSKKGPVVDPYHRMNKGIGYFTSMEVSHNDHEFIDERWDFGGVNSILAENRARGGYVFNRMVFHDFLSKPGGAMNNFSRFYYDEAKHIADYASVNRPIGGLNDSKWIEYDDEAGKDMDRSRYEEMLDETFNTSKEPVIVSLKPGLNFLGNPFMVPISLNPLIGFKLNGEDMFPGLGYMDDAKGIGELTPDTNTVGVKVSSVNPDGADLRAKYWLINEAFINYDDANDLFRFKAKYDYISRVGGATLAIGVNKEEGTTTEDDPGVNLNGIKPLDYLIAPMQMFCLQAAREVDIKLDMDLLSKFGKTNFLKNAEATTKSDEIMKDWFVVEVKNEKDYSTDRMSVVFNDAAKSYSENDPYDTSKGVSEKFAEFVPEFNGERTRTKYEGSTGIIYTKSTDGNVLLGNAVPSKTKELGLFFVAPQSTEELTLRFYGLENIEAVPGVWLIDRHLDKKVRIYPGDEYTFISDVSTTKTYTADNNRFVLKFYDEEEDVINKDDKDIFCYYQGSSIYVTNLIEEDINSDVQVFDLQGRLILKGKINDAPRESFVKPLSLGTYIVKVTGKRNHTSRIVNTGK